MSRLAGSGCARRSLGISALARDERDEHHQNRHDAQKSVRHFSNPQLPKSSNLQFFMRFQKKSTQS
jgi:hypothetical protein